VIPANTSLIYVFSYTLDECDLACNYFILGGTMFRLIFIFLLLIPLTVKAKTPIEIYSFQPCALWEYDTYNEKYVCVSLLKTVRMSEADRIIEFINRHSDEIYLLQLELIDLHSEIDDMKASLKKLLAR